MTTQREVPQPDGAYGHAEAGTAAPPIAAEPAATQIPPAYQGQLPPASAPPYSTPPALPAPIGAVFCRGCGSQLHPQAAICPNCGVPTGAGQAPLRPANPKSKSTAVILAVLFGLFGWLYTYQRNNWKFWLNLGIGVLSLGLWALVAWVWAIVDVAVKPSEWYEGYPNVN